MKKYIILKGENQSGIACFDENLKKLAVNLDGYEKLEKGEYFAIYADGKGIGKTAGGKGSFRLDKIDGGIKVMREKTGSKQTKTEYTSEEEKKKEPEKPAEEKKEDTAELIRKSFKWQKIRGYYCIKNLEIAKHVMGSENVYSAINRKGYYLYGESENKFAIAVPPIGGESPFSEDVGKFAEKLRIMGGDYYTVFMGADKNGEYFLRLADSRDVS